MIIAKYPAHCVSEAILEIAILNPNCRYVTMSPQSFLYFIYSCGNNIHWFGKWKDKDKKIFNYNNTACDIDIHVDPFFVKEKAYFSEDGINPTITVELSG